MTSRLTLLGQALTRSEHADMRDVAEPHVKALDHREAFGECFIVANREFVGIEDIAKTLHLHPARALAARRPDGWCASQPLLIRCSARSFQLGQSRDLHSAAAKRVHS